MSAVTANRSRSLRFIRDGSTFFWTSIRKGILISFATLAKWRRWRPVSLTPFICSHNLEHYYRHDVPKVLAGFLHVLKDDGFVQIRVPDLGELMKTVVQNGLDVDDFLYQSPSGPISVLDVLYGYGVELEQSGCDFFSHKTGFTEKSLIETLKRSRFAVTFTGCGNLEIMAYAFKNRPTPSVLAALNLPPFE